MANKELYFFDDYALADRFFGSEYPCCMTADEINEWNRECNNPYATDDPVDLWTLVHEATESEKERFPRNDDKLEYTRDMMNVVDFVEEAENFIDAGITTEAAVLEEVKTAFDNVGYDAIEDDEIIPDYAARLFAEISKKLEADAE